MPRVFLIKSTALVQMEQVLLVKALCPQEAYDRAVQKRQTCRWTYNTKDFQTLETKTPQEIPYSPCEVHYQIEWHSNYWSDSTSLVGKMAYVLKVLSDRFTHEKAFEMWTGIDPVHIIPTENNSLYDVSGEELELA